MRISRSILKSIGIENGGNQQNEGQQNWQPNMIVEHVGQRYVDKFKTKGLDYFVRIDNLEGDNNAGMHVNDLTVKVNCIHSRNA